MLELLCECRDTSLKVVSHLAGFLPSETSRCFQLSDQTPSAAQTQYITNWTH